LTITDLSTGCVSSFTSTGTVNPDYLCGVVSIENVIGNSLNIYPNPFNEFLIVELELQEVAELKIDLTDMLGRKIALKSATEQSGNFQESFDLSNISSGVYFIELTIEGEKLVKKVIKP